MEVKELIDEIVNGYEPSITEMISVLELNEAAAEYLFLAADKIRQQFCGNEIHIRGIIEFSNYCRCKCLYCGLTCENQDAVRYRMGVQEILDNAKEAYEAGYKTLVLQSGEDMWYTKEIITEIVKGIKAIGDIAITLSVGERSYEEYKEWKEAGADRFLIKHETADEELYNKLHPHSTFKNRIQCQRWLKELGYQLGSGFMIGLPGQTMETIAKDIQLLKDLDVDMAGIGPFISHPQTKLSGNENGSTFLTMKAVALARIINKKIHLPATTALGVMNSKHKDRVFSTGANVIMLKVEPYKYRRLYEIYPKSIGQEKTVKEERQQLENYIKSLGRVVSEHRGDTLK